MDDLSQKIKKFNRIRILNKSYMTIFSLFSLSLVIYGLTNNDKDTVFEYIFFFIVIISTLINSYLILFKTSLAYPSSNPKKLLLKKYEEMERLTNYFMLGYMQPLIIGDLAIIAFEFPHGEGPLQPTLLIILIICMSLGMLLANRTKAFLSKNYEELSGEKLIVFFP